jgi:hypothetical protein
MYSLPLRMIHLHTQVLTDFGKRSLPLGKKDVDMFSLQLVTMAADGCIWPGVCHHHNSPEQHDLIGMAQVTHQHNVMGTAQATLLYSEGERLAVSHVVGSLNLGAGELHIEKDFYEGH